MSAWKASVIVLLILVSTASPADDREVDRERFDIVYGSETLRSSPWQTVAEFLRDSALTSGGGPLDLRRLGEGRSLVLLDGRRLVRASDGTVDLDAIPLAAIERVEIATGSGDKLMGDGALVGVINLVTRDSGEGFAARAEHGGYAAGDGEVGSYDLWVSGEAPGSSWSLMASFLSGDPVFAADRAISEEPLFGTGTAYGSSATPQGLFRFREDDFDDLTTRPGTLVQSPADLVPGDFSFGYPGAGTDRYNLVSPSSISPELQRTSLLGGWRIDLQDDLLLSVDALWSEREETRRLPSARLDLGWFGEVAIAEDSRFNIFGVELPADDYFVHRRLVEAGPSTIENDRHDRRLTVGLEGRAGNHQFALSAGHARFDGELTDGQQVDYASVARALSGAPCREDSWDDGCVELDPFGGQGPNGTGTISAAMLDYILFDAVTEESGRLDWFDAELAGQYAGFGAGPMTWAASMGWRREYGRQTPDSRITSLNANLIRSGTRGQVSAHWLAGQIDLALAPGLDASIGGRFEALSNTDDESAVDLRLRWQVNPSLALHAGWNQGFRLASLDQRFGPVRFDPSQLGPYDPCNSLDTDGDYVPDTAPDLPGCAGVPDYYTQTDPQSGLVGANEDAGAETATHWGLGLDWKTDAWGIVDGRLAARRVEIDDRLSILDGQALVNACAYDLRHCENVHRSSSIRSLDGYDQTWLNDGGLEGTFFDIDLRWRDHTGRLLLDWFTTYTAELDRIDPVYRAEPGSPTIESRYDVQSLIGIAGVAARWDSELGASWHWSNAWTARWGVRYQHRTRERCWANPAFGLCNLDFDGNGVADDGRRLGSTTYHDVELRYRRDALGIAVGVRNVFDKGPPLSTIARTGFYPGYRIPERFPYIRVEYRPSV